MSRRARSSGFAECNVSCRHTHGSGRAVVAASAGFTLLEMLLVVFILGSLAFTATAFVDNQDDQQRYEDTRARLGLIRRAVVGPDASPVPAGYVADNGVLPGAIGDLADAMPAGFAASGLLAPVFDADPDLLTGLSNDVSPTELTGWDLEKGWRPALHTSPGAAAFGDGWRTAGAWTFTPGGASLSVTSQGKDGAAGGTGYDADLTDTVNAGDWGAEIGGLTVRVRNQTGSDIVLASPATLRVSLLIFVNTATGAKWKRFTTDSASCLDGDGDGLVGGIPCDVQATLTFPAGGYPETRVPLGRHLLVVVRDPDNSAHNNDDTPYPGAATAVALPIVCAAAGCPLETLVLK